MPTPYELLKESRAECELAEARLRTLIFAAQYVCQTVNGSDPVATKRAHDLALVRLMDALNEVNP